ncbi:methyltransferase family protein [Palleronia aestuarii]|uniref:Methyltransferase family protein n=1 Tax=Palleronia aestuarii TaxID=568105 RepID=A0A2W7N1R2_9RHOB|nr:class I SAM-dependent methyltransferase [Palleronia aestuarii]PZX14345.1 methyltransferase family protein [Palleronia aestuarii]
MEVDEITELYRAVWRKGWGSVSIDELVFIRDLVRAHRPAAFLEIGMASGLSSGFIARFLGESGGKSFTSIDHDDTFFGDPTKPNGFLFDEIHRGGTLDARLVKFKTSLDVEELGTQWEMAFIDANHQHPWPILDTLSIWPRLSGPKIVIHHDLQLYMKQDVMFGIGPKYLFDQMPEGRRILSDANDGNIFALDLDMERDELEEIAIRAIKLPWSLRSPLQPAYVAKIRAMLERFYSPRLVAHFDRCLAGQNREDRFRSGL